MESKLTAALKRVDDLLSEHPVFGKTLAFNEIKNIISQAARAKNSWSEELESLVKKSLYLSIDLRKSKDAKQVLQTYKQFCVGTNLASFDNILGLYMDLAENRLRKAIRDLGKSNEATSSVEITILKQISGDSSSGVEKEVLSPWIKFAFDAYVSVMEIVKSTSLEKRYHNAAHRGFNLCKEFKRVSEFKILSQELRKHFEQAQANSQNAEESQKKGFYVLTQESRQSALDTRFKEISVAFDLSLWQDSYRCIQEIHEIIESLEETPDKKTMKKFYTELAKVFWVSKDYPLYAYTLLQIFNFTNKIETKVKISTNFLLAILSIPTTYDKSLRDADKHSKQLVLSEVLDLSHMLSREELIRDMHGVNLLSYVIPEAAEAYRILEEDFSPIDMCEKMSVLLKAFESHPEYSQFTTPLKDATVTKLLTQLAQVYDNIGMDDVLAYSAGLYSFSEIERLLMDITQSNQISASFDQKNNIIHFGQGLNMFEADNFKGLLQKFNAKLRAIAKSLPNDRVFRPVRVNSDSIAKIRDAELSAFNYHNKVQQFKKEHKKVLEIMVEEEFEETKLREAEEERMLQEEEAKRLQREREREALEAKKQEQMKQLYSQLVNAPSVDLVGKITSKKVDDLIQKKQEEIEKKKLDKEKKLNKTIKHMNYFERALREAEAGLLESAHNSEEAAARDAYNSRIKKLKDRQERQAEVFKKQHELLKDVFAFEQEFLSRTMGRRNEIYKKEKAEYDAEYNEALTLWKQRREKVAAHWEELQRKKEEENARKLQEEEEARERERIDREAREAVEAENRRKAEMIAEKEREKEMEKEQSRFRRPESSSGAYQPPYGRSSGAYVPPSARGGEESGSSGAYRPPYGRSSGAYVPPSARGGEESGSSGAYRPPFARGESRPEPSGGAYRPPFARGESRPEPSSGAYRPPMRSFERSSEESGSSGAYKPPFRSMKRDEESSSNNTPTTQDTESEKPTDDFGDDWNVVSTKKTKGKK